MATALLPINNCLDCPHHQTQRDPDPDDWFCADDEKVVCLKTKRTITNGCRPYQTRKECSVPSWCPLIEAKPEAGKVTP